MLVHLNGEKVRQAIIAAARKKARSAGGEHHVNAALYAPEDGQVDPARCQCVVQLVKEIRERRAA